MKRFLTLAFALTLVTGVAAGCGGDKDSESGSATTTEASGGSGGSTESGGSGSGTSNTGNEKVDAYCNQVNEFAETAIGVVVRND